MPWLVPVGEGILAGGEVLLGGAEAAEGVEAANLAYRALQARRLADAARSALAAKKLLDAIREGSQSGTCDHCDDPPDDPCKHLKKGNGGGKYRGGGHEQTAKPVNDGLDSHHMPSSDSIKGTLGREDGPAVQMEPADHHQTASWGNSKDAVAYRARQTELIRNGKFTEAFANDVQDARRIAAEAGDPKRYDQAIKEALAYLDCLSKHNLTSIGGPD